MQNELLCPNLAVRWLFAAVFAVAVAGCQDSMPSINLPAVMSGDAEVYSFNSETKKIDHVTMAIDEAVNAPGKTVVIDFFADWCGPCKMLSPELEKVAEELNGKVVVVKVDIVEHPELAQQFQVSSIPDVRFFKDGKAIGGFMGFRTADRIIPMLQN